jgi:uncharacterized OsmC-like protein
MKTTIAKINGVNVEALNETIQAIRATPAIADFKFRVNNQWIDGGNNRSITRSFYGACQEHQSHDSAFAFEADEPPILLGENRGANPVEFALHALAACITTSLVYHAAARGIQVEGVRSSLEGDLDLHGFLGLDPKVRKGYKVIRIKFEIDGDLTQDQKEMLVKLGKKFSPVHEMISASVPLEVSVS